MGTRSQAGAGAFFSSIARRSKRGGKDFLAIARTALRQASEIGLTNVAGSLSFTTTLSLAPLLAVLFYVFKVFGGLEYAYAKLMPFLLKILSEGTGEIVSRHLESFIRQVHARAVGWAGFAGLAVTAIMTYASISGAFHKIWDVRGKVSFAYRALRALTLLTIGPLLLSASLAVTAAIAARVKFVPHSGQVIAYLLSVGLFAMVYALVPAVKLPVGLVVRASLVPAALLEAAKLGYAIYTKRMVSYSAFYGSFAAIPLFLLWIYIGWCITLFGAVWLRAMQLHKPVKG